MSDLSTVVEAFYQATHCEVAVWTQGSASARLQLEAAAGPAPPTTPPERLPAANEEPLEIGGTERVILASIPGPRRAWLALGPCSASSFELHTHLKYLVPVVGTFLQSALEVEHAANELAERYEEINLLYTISEILGRTVSLTTAASTILTEISETVGARRAVILVYDELTRALEPVATQGIGEEQVTSISIDDDCAVSARVFRTSHPTIVEGDQDPCEQERPFRRGAMLSVPILWTAPDGMRPLGVVNLSDRRSGQPFSAGDQKLIAAIATQIGTAIQNARLVNASLNEQRLAQEMRLAHDLQMKLLPDTHVVAPDAIVAARVVPAEDVGGDFYNLFPLGAGRTGIMIGDVSGHGYQAALIMALTMSATAIHAQTTADPGETLSALHSTMHDELGTTEMFISAFYAVVDKPRKLLRFTNTGHPHAFVFGEEGGFERLAATDPPLGMSSDSPTTREHAWRPGRDLLVLFTDGISDARNRAGERLGEERVLEVVKANAARTPAEVLDAVFELLDDHIEGAPRRDDLTFVAMRG